MITRFGDFAHSQKISDLTLQAQTRARETQIQLSSSKVSTTYAGLGGETSQLLAAKADLFQNQQFAKDNELVISRLQVMEASVSSLSDIANRLQSLLVQRTSDGAGAPGVLANEAEIMLKQATSSLNARLHDRYLFAGSQVDTPPVELDPAFAGFGGPDTTYYQGDAVDLSVRADKDLTFSYGVRADREGFQELIGALRTVIEADPIDDEDLLDDAIDLVASAIPKIADTTAEIGARQAQLEQINEVHLDVRLFVEQRISDIENIDVAEAITRLSQEQVVIESALATVARLSQLSLVDFLS